MTNEQLQVGLYVYRYKKKIGNVEYTFGNLYSSEGYCFYEKALPEEERQYMTYRTLTTDEAILSNEDLSALFMSIPHEEGVDNG